MKKVHFNCLDKCADYPGAEGYCCIQSSKDLCHGDIDEARGNLTRMMCKGSCQYNECWISSDPDSETFQAPNTKVQETMASMGFVVSNNFQQCEANSCFTTLKAQMEHMEDRMLKLEKAAEKGGQRRKSTNTLASNQIPTSELLQSKEILGKKVWTPAAIDNVMINEMATKEMQGSSARRHTQP